MGQLLFGHHPGDLELLDAVGLPKAPESMGCLPPLEAHAPQKHREAAIAHHPQFSIAAVVGGVKDQIGVASDRPLQVE